MRMGKFNFYDKKNVVLMQNLKQAEDHGLVLKKVQSH